MFSLLHDFLATTDLQRLYASVRASRKTVRPPRLVLLVSATELKGRAQRISTREFAAGQASKCVLLVHQAISAEDL